MGKKFLCTLLSILTILTIPIFSANAALFEKPDLDLSSKYALVINLNTDTEVYSLNPDDMLFPASTTKILTAILTIEACADLDEKVEVTKSAMNHVDLYSSQVGLLVGETLSVRDLLALMMVKSGSDAACVLAEYVSGSFEDFVALMNQKASELGCTGTHFVNPTGMHSADHYSTARDIAIIAKYALKNPIFCEFFQMKQVKVEKTELSDSRFFSTTNYLIDLNRGGKYYYKYATGGKTGTTTPAGRCLVSTAKKGETEYLCLVFGAEGDNSKGINKAFSDSSALYSWCFENLSLTKVASCDEPLFETKLRYAWNHDYVTLTVSQDVYAIMPNGASTEIKTDTGTEQGLLVSPDIPEHLNAPVVKGDAAGSALYYFRDASGETKLASASLVVFESVNRNFFSFIFTKIGNFFTSKAALIILLILIVLLISLIIFRLVRRSKSRKSSRYRRRRYRGYKRY